MIRGNVFLDTNIVVAFLEGDTILRKQMSRSESVALPSVALGELLFGAENSGRPEDNRKRVVDFATTIDVAPVDEDTAHYYAAIRSALRKAGCPIPDNDIWIAAICQQHGAVLATRDQHFEHVDGLETERW